MKITADTNILVRAITGDHAAQSRRARAELAAAEMVAVPVPVLCELAWVLARGCRIGMPEIAAVIRRLMAADNVALDHAAVAAGLAVLEAGGDFADGAIAHEGRVLGGAGFVSFDRAAMRLLAAGGVPARLPR